MIRILLLALLFSTSAFAQVTLSPIPQGFIGNSGAAAALPAPLTSQQAAALVAPFIPSGGGGSTAGPWLNAAAPGNGCASIVSAPDATAALQCDIDWMFTNYQGGIIQLPPGQFTLSATVVIKGGVTLWGSGSSATVVKVSTDTPVFIMDSSVKYGGFRDLWALGFISSAASQPAVVVALDVPVILRDSWIWGGSWAIDTSGVDGLYENLYINGWGTGGGGIKSVGANWYVRDKINAWPQAVNVGFYQAVTGGASVKENHFTECDFSGNYQYSLYIADGGANTAITVITGSVMANPISIPNHNMTILIGNEIGSNSFYVGAGNLVATGNVAFHGTTIAGPGTRTCAGNLQLIC